MTDPASPPENPGALDKEPVAVFGAALIGAITAGLALADSLGWLPLTAEQTTGIVAFITALGAAIGALLRARVYSRATVARLKAAP